tara:strand:- start:106 stop:384 length:279 start_codon:yes stop_codon:yes gene_type:complete
VIKHTYQSVLNEAMKAEFNSSDPNADVDTRQANRTTPSVTTNKEYVKLLTKQGLMEPKKPRDKMPLKNPNENTLKRYTDSIKLALEQNTEKV